MSVSQFKINVNVTNFKPSTGCNSLKRTT